MNEPIYRKNVEAPDVTHVGIGVSEDAHHALSITMLYTNIVPRIDAEQLTAKVIELLNDRGAIPSAHVNRLLTRLALAYASDLARGWSEKTLWRAYQVGIRELARAYRSLERTMIVQLDATHVSKDIRTELVYNFIGFGVAQSARNGALAGRIWIVFFGAVTVRVSSP